MAGSTFLLRPLFWVLFILGVIISLYFYGLNILGDRTQLAQMKISLEALKVDLNSCRDSNKLFSNQVYNYQGQIKSLQDIITNSKDAMIQEKLIAQKLLDSLNRLNSLPPKIQYQDKIIYQDMIVYREKPEVYHPYGKGYGNITLYKTCNCYNLKFWIDGVYAGNANGVFHSYPPSCNQNGTVSQILLAGKHHIQGRDQENNSWDFYLTVNEDQCLVRGVNKKN